MRRRVAFLVGNSNFGNDSGLTKLCFPPADVEGLAEVLTDRAIGRFDRIERLIERTKDDILNALADLLDRERGATVLFYYSGHGVVSDSGRLFLAASNTTQRLLPANGVAFASIFAMKDDYGCGRFCAVLDCCYAGLGSPNVKGSEDEQLKAFADGRGIFFLGAASATVAAREDPKLGHGVLTAAIIEGLKSGSADMDNDGRITGPDLFKWCRDFAAELGSHGPVQNNQVSDDDLVIAFSKRGVPAISQLYVPAQSATTRPRLTLLTLKHNDTFAVFDSHGDIGVTAGNSDGLFDRDTRYLSHLELLINGTQPLLLGSAIRDDNLSFHADQSNADVYENDQLVLPKDVVHIGRTIYLSDGSLRERISLSNHGAQEIALTLSLAFASDFADLEEVRGTRRKDRGQAWSRILGGGRVVLSYRGIGETLRETAVSFEPAPTLQMESVATYALRLAAKDKRTIFINVSSRGLQHRSTQSFFQGLAILHRERRAATRSVAAVETSNSVLNEILVRSMSDLYMLLADTPEGLNPNAGLYSTSLDRDGVVTALEMLWVDPAIARGVLRRFPTYQANAGDQLIDAEPGKILHEAGGGEMTVFGEAPSELHYGRVDCAPLFVMLAGLYAQRTGDYVLIRELWPAIEGALTGIEKGDLDGDGFIEYAAAMGLANQGWKDSHDAVFHADGRLAEGPIALVEVQGYVYAAKCLAAACARRLGMAERADALQRQAEELQARFEEGFWCEEIGTYALALDGAKRQCKVRTSNAGQALATGIARKDRAHRVANGLLHTRFHSGWGIRTVASGEARYNPMSHHNGSIWPHDNALIAQGFARYGHKNRINLIFDGLVRATTYMEHRRIPELYCGFRRRPGRGPTLYPAACSPQACAAGAPFLMLQAMLGLEFDHAARKVLLVNPSLPASAGRIIIRNLTLADANIDFALSQDGEGVAVQVLRTFGDLQISLVV